MFRESHSAERRAEIGDDAVGLLNLELCPEYKALKTRFDSARDRYAQFSDKKNCDLIGAYSERATKIRRETRANMALLGQHMFDHRASCLICWSETKGQRSV